MKTIRELLHIPYPIIQGGMGNISNPILTAAISEAGGLGTIGVWIAIASSVLIEAAIIAVYYKKGRWKDTSV